MMIWVSALIVLVMAACVLAALAVGLFWISIIIENRIKQAKEG